MCERLKQTVLKKTNRFQRSIESSVYQWSPTLSGGQNHAQVARLFNELFNAFWAVFPVLLLAASLLGCGSMRAVNPLNPPSVDAAAPPFPPAQTLTCNGDYLSPAGMICDESDGANFYNHYHWSVSVRPDGHGTFQISTEQGSRKSGLYQIAAPFPYIINIVELHPTLSVNSYCAGNGFESKWDGAGINTVEHLIGSKAYRFDASGISQDFPVSQVIYPQPVPVSNLILYTFTDLCSVSTLHWTVTGSF